MRSSRLSGGSSPLFVEVRIEYANLGNLRNRQLVAGRGPADGLRRGAVINAESTLAIGRDVGMNPGDAVLDVVVDDLAANSRTVLVQRNAEAVRKVSFDQVAGHGSISDDVRVTRVRRIVPCRRPDRIGRTTQIEPKAYPYW